MDEFTEAQHEEILHRAYDHLDAASKDAPHHAIMEFESVWKAGAQNPALRYMTQSMYPNPWALVN